MKRFIYIIAILAFSGSAYAQDNTRDVWSGRIIRAQNMEELTQDQMIRELSTAQNIIMGEKHYTTPVQQTEGLIIREVVKFLGAENNFTTAWEFLNGSEQELTDRLYQQFVRDEITVLDFLHATQSGHGDEYAPMLEATKAFGGKLIGVNLSRKEKAPILKGGLSSADPSLIPSGFDFGTVGYHERFIEAMSDGHASPQVIENYYAAQCLTDDVMAYRMIEGSAHDPRFLVAGSFHVDYSDGAVNRLRIRSPGERTLSISIVDASDYSEAELLGLVKHEKYGELADFVYFVNEPSRH